jgi:hypothetical protein
MRGGIVAGSYDPYSERAVCHRLASPSLASAASDERAKVAPEPPGIVHRATAPQSFTGGPPVDSRMTRVAGRTSR